MLCEHELPGTARHDPLAYLQNRTVDWLDHQLAARELLPLDVANTHLVVEHEYPAARIQDRERLKPILQGSLAFVRRIDEAAGVHVRAAARGARRAGHSDPGDRKTGAQELTRDEHGLRARGYMRVLEKQMRQPRLLETMFAMLVVVLAVGASIRADEGMWTFDNFPIARANQALGYAYRSGVARSRAPELGQVRWLFSRDCLRRRPGDDQQSLRRHLRRQSLDADGRTTPKPASRRGAAKTN